MATGQELAARQAKIMRAIELEAQGNLSEQGQAALAFLRDQGIAPPRNQMPEPSAIESVGRGYTDVGQGIRQLIPESIGGFTADQEAEARADENRYVQGHGGGLDVFRGVGQAAATAPLAAIPGLGSASIAARAGAGAASGAAGGGLLFAPEEGDRLANMLIGGGAGGLLGAAVPSLARGVAKGVKGAGQLVRQGANALNPAARAEVQRLAAQAAIDAGTTLDELGTAAAQGLRETARNAASRGVGVDPEALARQARAARFGFVDEAAPLRGQMNRDPTTFSREQNLAKLEAGEPLSTRFSNQRRQVSKVLDDTGDQLGARADITPFSAGEAAEGAVQKRAEDWQKTVTRRYDEARLAAPDATVNGSALRDATGDIIEEVDLPNSVLKRIKTLSDMDGIPPIQLERLDKMLTRNMGKDLATDRALGILKENVRGVMDDFANDFGGAYRGAVGEAAKRFGAIGPPRGLTGQLVRGALDPEKIAARVMAGSTRQLKRLRDFISDADPDAWNSVVSAAWNKVVDDAMPGGNFTQAGFNRALKRIGPERLKILFGDEQAKQLVEFGKVANDLFNFPSGHSVNTSNTASTLANQVGSVAETIGGAFPGGRLVAAPFINAARANAAGIQQADDVARALGGAADPLGMLRPRTAQVLTDYSRLSAPLGGLIGANSN